MKKIYIATICEIAKLKNSNVFKGTLALFIFIPMMMGLMVYVVQHPELSAKLGIIAVKASILSGADWPAFLNLILQLIATLGFIGFGFVTAWVFGSEYMEHTIKDILAMPVTRNQIIIAKFIVTLLWSLLLSIIMLAMSFIVGKYMNLAGWSAPLFFTYAGRYFFAALLTFALSSPVAFTANYGRGIIAPLGLVLVTMIMAQFTVYMGLGPYFPWAIPGLSILPAAEAGMQISAASYILLTITFVFFFAATMRYFRNTDHV